MFTARRDKAERAVLAPSAPAVADVEFNASCAQAVQPGAQERGRFHVRGKHTPGGAFEGADAELLRPVTQFTGSEILQQRLEPAGALAVARQKGSRRFRVGEIEPALAGEQELASDGRHRVVQIDLDRSRSGDIGNRFRRHEACGTAADYCDRVLRFHSSPITHHPSRICHRHGDGLSHLDAVDRGRKNTARVARTFPGRVEAAGVDALVVRTAPDADGRRGARLDAGHYRVFHGVAADLLFEHGQSLAYRRGRVVGNAGGEIGHADTRRVRWLHRAEPGRGPAREKVTHALRGRAVVAAAGFERAFLPVALKLDAGKRMPGIVRRRDADHDAAVGVALVARVLAHAVGDDPSRFRCCSHHRAAGAHAEAVNRAPVPAVMDQLVVGGAEQRMAGVLPVARAVDERLRVLDAKADREWLGLNMDAAIVEHLESVARAVADGQHDVVGGDAFSAGDHYAANLPVVDFDISDFAAEADFTAQSMDGVAQALDHAHQPEGADVWLGHIENFGRRAGFDEFREDFAPQETRVFHLAVELAVGERAGAAFAELDIGFGVQHRFAPQAPGVPGALAHGFAAFED